LEYIILFFKVFHKTITPGNLVVLPSIDSFGKL
jgi:hypothetical protein